MINFIKQMIRAFSVVLAAFLICIGVSYFIEYMTLQGLIDLGVMFILSIFALIGACLISWAWEK